MQFKLHLSAPFIFDYKLMRKLSWTLAIAHLLLKVQRYKL